MTQEEIFRFWNEDADDYDKIIADELNSFRVERWTQKILSEAGQNRPLKILDIGCGPGFFSILMARAGQEVTAIDGAQEMLRRAKKNAAREGVSVKFFQMDCQKTDFAEDTFDLIINRNVTHALKDHRKAYAEWRRILKPGGVLLIFDANWHLTVKEGPLREQYLKDTRACILRYGSDFNGHTDPEQLVPEPLQEHILGDVIRPEWDLKLLAETGYTKAEAENHISDYLWDEKEKLIYGTTPMFMIRAEKEPIE